jgi:hypothetical protein
MDQLKNFNFNFNKINLKEFLNLDYIIIFSLIIYISITSINIPLHLLSLINKPISKILILILIFYYSNKNIVISLFLTIALLVSINLYTKIDKFKTHNYYEKFIIKKNNRKKISIDDNSDDDNSDDDNSDDDNSNDDNSDDDNSNDDNSNDDNSDDDNSDDDNSDDNENYLDKGFDPKNIKTSKNLNDTFTTLHKTIHELENFISKQNNNINK